MASHERQWQCMHAWGGIKRLRKWKGNAKLIVEAWGGVKIRA